MYKLGVIYQTQQPWLTTFPKPEKELKICRTRHGGVFLTNFEFENMVNTVSTCYRSFSLSRSKKINRKPFSGLSQDVVTLLEINKKKDASPSFTSVRSPKPQIFVEMFRRNLQSSV